MKKYLLITQRCPYPPHKNGGVHTIYNIIRNIPDDIEFDLFYYYEKDLQAEKVIGQFVNEIMNYCFNKKPTIMVRGLNFLKGIPDYFSELDVKGFTTKIEYEKYDVVILDQIYSLPFVENIPSKIPIISMMHDNNVLLYERKKLKEKSFIKKFYDKKQCLYFQKIEDKYFDRLDKILYVSSLDAQVAKENHPRCKSVFDDITLGVDVPTREELREPKNNSIVFSGVMDYGPNEDAAYYFSTKVFPYIKLRFPDAEFVIAGKNPTKKLKEVTGNGIIITGFVENMYETISSSEIYVSPLRYGSGTKNKVLEAMAVGMPVFLSEVSREGIDGLVDGVNCFYIDDENIERKICETLKDKQLLKRVARCGKEYVEKKHSWKNVFTKFLLD